MVAAMGVGLFLGALLAIQVSAEIEPRETACPSASELARELERAGAVGVPAPDLVVDHERMRVTLRGQDGALLGSREVDAPASCDERATIAAVLVATWMGIWPATPARVAAPAPERTPPVTRPDPTSATGRRVELGLQVGGAHDGNAGALAAAFELRRAMWGPLHIALGASMTSEREQRVGVAHAGYLRPAIELGPFARLGRGGLQGELAASGRLGLLLLRGKRLPIAHRTSHLIPGVAASVRLVLARERVSPFLVAGVAYWLAGQRVTLDDDDATATLPRLDVMAGLGLVWAP
jgi:hypothetical protein